MTASESSAEEFGKKVYEKAGEEMRDSAPKVAINVAVAVLIWIVGNYVFIPISQGYFIQSWAVPWLINLIVFVALVVILLMILRELRDLSDAAAGLVAYELGSRKGEVTPKELSDYKTAFHGLLYVFVAAAAFLLLGSQLSLLSPALAALVLIVVVIWAVATLFRVGRALSDTVRQYAHEWAKKLEERAR
jgi:amino acid transporter